MATATSTISLPGRTEPRIKYKEKTVEGILSFDSDNAYPQRVLYSLAASGTATSCAELLRDYTAGLGFRDETFGKQIVNRFGQTANDLLAKVSDDFSRVGFALVAVVYNALFKAAEWIYVPAEFGRYCLPDPLTGKVEKVAIYNDWNQQKSKRIEKDKIQFLPLYNPEKAAEQFEQSGLPFEAWPGQVLVISKTALPEYTLAPCDPVLRDIETDGLIQVFKNRVVTKGFMPNGIFGHPGKFESQEKRDAFVSSLMEYQGAENSNAIILCEWDTPEMKPEFIPMVFPNVDKVFELTEATVKENIREKYKVPPILLTSSKEAGGVNVGDSKELENAKIYFDEITAPNRKFMSETFQRLGSSAAFPVPSDYSILSIGESITAAGSFFLKSLGEAAVSKIMEVINSSWSIEQKRAFLVDAFGINEERAEKLTPEPVQNPTP